MNSSRTTRSRERRKGTTGRNEASSRLWLSAIVLLASLIKNDMALKDFFSSTIKYVKPVEASLSSLVPTANAQEMKQPAQYNLKDRGVTLTDADIEAFRPLLYGEVSNRTPDKQALEANVILNTALNRVKAYNEKGMNKSLSDVLAMPNQYQAYGGPQYKVYSNPTLPGDVAKKKQIDDIVNTIHSQIKSGQFPDNTQGAYYYSHNPKTGTIAYDNMRPLFSK